MSAQSLALKTLQGARELIAKPDAWRKGFYAGTADGRDVFSGESGAICFCSIGALSKVARDIGGPRIDASHPIYCGAVNALRRQPPEGCNENIAAFNDDEGTAHSDVLRVFDAAIAELSA